MSSQEGMCDLVHTEWCIQGDGMRMFENRVLSSMSDIFFTMADLARRNTVQ